MNLSENVLKLLGEDSTFFKPEVAKKEVSKILDSLAKVSHGLVEKYQGSIAGNSSSPSAPDTSKFISQHSGMIEYMSNEVVRDRFPRFVSTGVKIGRNVDIETTKAIKKEFIKMFNKFQSKFGGDGTSHIRVRFGDEEYGPHYSITLIDVSGSNWGCVGVQIEKRDGNGDHNTKISHLYK